MTPMTTDDLIASLSREARPVPRRLLARRAALGLAAAAAVTGLAFALGWGPRPGLAAALGQPMVAAKTLWPLLLAATALPLALALARPAGRSRARGFVWLAPLLVAALVAGALGTESDRLAAFLGHSIHVCLPSIVALSAPALAALIWALRAGAPERPGLAGGVAGLAAGGFGAALYSAFCTEDSPLFYGTWYAAAVLAVAALGALAGRRWLRW